MANRRMRVTHVIHELGPGGAEQVLVDLCEACSAVAVDVNVLSLMPLEGHAYPARLREHGVSVSSLSLPSRWDIRGLRRAVAAIADTQPDVIHTHMKHADLLGALAGRRLNVPMVSTLHVIEDAPTPLGRFKRMLAGQARLRGADRTVAVSDAVRRWYLDEFPAKPDTVVTIRNGRAAPPSLPDAARLELRRELGLDERTIGVAVVGIMRPGKGHAAVLEVARLLKEVQRAPAPEVRFLLAGDGPLRGELEAAAGRLGVAAAVSFLGYRNDIPALLQASDVFVHASDFDALPTALIEALAAGIPSVAFDVGGVPEIVTAETGCLVEAGDGHALTAAVADLAADRERRIALGEQARKRFASEFEALTWAGRLRGLYVDILEERQPR